MAARKLISGGRIVSVDPDIGTLVGDILIDGDVIVAVGEVDEVEAGAAEVIDARNMIAMPGFVDAHRHTWQSAIRHRNGDRYGEKYFEEVLFTIAPRYSADDVYVGTLLGALSAIDAGTTTLFDWAHPELAGARGLVNPSSEGVRSACSVRTRSLAGQPGGLERRKLPAVLG